MNEDDEFVNQLRGSVMAMDEQVILAQGVVIQRLLGKIRALKKVTPEIGAVNWDGVALLQAINALFDELPKEAG